MKKFRLTVLLLSILLVFVTLKLSFQKNNTVISEILASASINNVEVTYIHDAKATTWEIPSDKIAQWQLWGKSLSVKHKAFNEGNSPGDMDGGETYDFNINNGEASFSYIISGDDKYILLNGEWYSVLNPTDPPVENSSITE